MTSDQQREQEVGFLAVVCGFISWITIQLALTAAWWLGAMGFILGVGIAATTALLVTLVVGTVLLRALRKSQLREKAEKVAKNQRFYRPESRDWMN